MRFRRGRRVTASAPSPSGPDRDEAALAPERELASVASLSSALARAPDAETVGRTLIEECFSLLGVDFAAVALVSEDGKRAKGLLALARSGDEDWWPELALDRTRSANALADALEREQLVASIGRKVRSELDLEAVLRIAVEETGVAAGVTRCFLRLGEAGGPMPIRAEWDAEGFVPIGAAADKLAVTNLAARERRTVAVADVRAE